MNQLQEAQAAFGRGIPDDEAIDAEKSLETPAVAQERPSVKPATTGEDIVARAIGILTREAETLRRPGSQLAGRMELPVDRKLREARASGISRGVEILAQVRSGVR